MLSESEESSSLPTAESHRNKKESECYPFSDRHLQRHRQKMILGEYKISTFEDNLRQIHHVRRVRMQLKLKSQMQQRSEGVRHYRSYSSSSDEGQGEGESAALAEDMESDHIITIPESLLVVGDHRLRFERALGEYALTSDSGVDWVTDQLVQRVCRLDDGAIATRDHRVSGGISPQYAKQLCSRERERLGNVRERLTAVYTAVTTRPSIFTRRERGKEERMNEARAVVVGKDTVRVDVLNRSCQIHGFESKSVAVEECKCSKPPVFKLCRVLHARVEERYRFGDIPRPRPSFREVEGFRKFWNVSCPDLYGLCEAISSLRDEISEQHFEFISENLPENYSIPWIPGLMLFKVPLTKVSLEKHDAYDTIELSDWNEMANYYEMLLLTGPSSSTGFILQAALYTGLDSPENLLNLKIAIMGWLVTMRDHSFFEVIIGSHGYLDLGIFSNHCPAKFDSDHFLQFLIPEKDGFVILEKLQLLVSHLAKEFSKEISQSNSLSSLYQNEDKMCGNENEIHRQIRGKKKLFLSFLKKFYFENRFALN